MKASSVHWQLHIRCVICRVFLSPFIVVDLFPLIVAVFSFDFMFSLDICPFCDDRNQCLLPILHQPSGSRLLAETQPGPGNDRGHTRVPRMCPMKF